MPLIIHDGSINIAGLEMSLAELATLRPDFVPPAGQVTVRYDGAANIRSDGRTQTAGPAPWAAADALIAEKPALEAELDVLRNPPPGLAEAKLVQRQAVNALRDEKRSAGLSYSFPDSLTGTVDTVNQVDYTNLQALVTTAQVLAASGETGAVLAFRDAEDQTHALTPEEVIALGMAVTQHQAAIYAASWPIKDAITAAADQVALDAIDITAGWPV
jgi:hypothetical protein